MAFAKVTRSGSRVYDYVRYDNRDEEDDEK